MTPDTSVLFRKWLLTSSALLALLPSRDGLGNICDSAVSNNARSIYVGDMPKFFNPVDGPGVQITVRGGSGPVEIPDISEPSLQLRVWDAPREFVRARQIFRTIRSFAQGQNYVVVNGVGVVMACTLEVDGQDVTDPGTDWATVIGFFRLMARPE